MDPNTRINYPGQSAGATNSPQSVPLASGAIWQVPNGTFMLKLGPQSVLQWKDINSGLWRITDAGPSNHPIPVFSDGSNFRVLNASGTILGANITNAGTSYAATDTIAFAAPAAGSPSITAAGNIVLGGKLTFAITTAGTGYTNPTILVPGPWLLGGTQGGCIEAQIGAITLTTNTITAVAVNFAGAGYGVAPGANTTTITPAQFAANPQIYTQSTNLILIDPAGSGAVITPTLAGAGTITGIIMTNYGAGYDGTHIPAITPTTSTGSSFAATALPSMALKSITVAGTNTGYTASAMIETTLGNGTAIAQLNDEIVMPRAGRAVAAQSGGVLGTPVIEDAGNGFQTVPLAKQVGNATADGSVNATFTAVVGGVQNYLQYWQIG